MKQRERELERGELTRIIIGTVVASGVRGIRPRDLTLKLNSWGIPVTQNQMSARLNKLASAGRIKRIGARGLYSGM